MPTPITQLYVSGSVRFFEAALRRRHQLSPYTSRDRPALFFGCYRDDDLRAVLLHRAERIVIWGGTDATHRDRLDVLRRAGGCHHVAISDFVARDLESAGIPAVRLPIAAIPAGDDLVPGPKGDGVFVYTSRKRPAFYGAPLIERLRARLPRIRLHVCARDTHPPEDLVRVYRSCYLGLRLVPHDGLSNTVVELALLGIPTVYNGGLPGSLPWRHLDDVAAHVEAQRAAIGTTDEELPRRMREWLRLPPDWLTVEFFAARLGAGRPSLPRSLAVYARQRATAGLARLLRSRPR
jgi:hypothetical protein